MKNWIDREKALEREFLADVLVLVRRVLGKKLSEAKVADGVSIAFLVLEGEDKSDLSWKDVLVACLGKRDGKIKFNVEGHHASFGKREEDITLAVNEATPENVAARIVTFWG